MEFLLTFQPALGSADAPQDVYVARGADLVGEPEIDEAEAVRWVPIAEAQDMIRRGEILGAATVIGVLYAAAELAKSPRVRPEAADLFLLAVRCEFGEQPADLGGRSRESRFPRGRLPPVRERMLGRGVPAGRIRRKVARC